MNSPRLLSAQNILPNLHDLLDHLLHLQVCNRNHPDFGALIGVDYGIADPKTTELLIVAGGYHELISGEHDPSLVERMVWASEALLIPR